MSARVHRIRPGPSPQWRSPHFSPGVLTRVRLEAPPPPNSVSHLRHRIGRGLGTAKCAAIRPPNSFLGPRRRRFRLRLPSTIPTKTYRGPTALPIRCPTWDIESGESSVAWNAPAGLTRSAFYPLKILAVARSCGSARLPIHRVLFPTGLCRAWLQIRRATPPKPSRSGLYEDRWTGDFRRPRAYHTRRAVDFLSHLPR